MRHFYITPIVLAIFLGFSTITKAQIDIGITDLTIITPSALNAEKELTLGDTITKIEFKLYNYSAQSISGSDFQNDEVQISASYNGDFKITNVYLVGSINSQSGRVQNFPENFSSYNPFPKFPEGTGDVELCIYTQYNGDADISNDTACFEFTVVDENSSVAISEIQKENLKPTFYQAGSDVVVKSTEPIELTRLIDITGKEYNLDISGDGRTHLVDVESLPNGLFVLSYRDKAGSSDHFRIWVD